MIGVQRNSPDVSDLVPPSGTAVASSGSTSTRSNCGAVRIAVVIPCYRVRSSILALIARIPPEVERIICVDDACPEDSGRLVEERVTDARVSVLRNARNLGVGGAVKAGYLAARKSGCTIAVKLDGDGQMDPRLIPAFVYPIASGTCDYTKGNRFFRLEDVRAMPRIRLFGNAIMSFLAKFSTGYWNIFDPTNGYTALHLRVLDLLSLDKVANRYFFETDLLFRLNVARCAVRDIPMIALYGVELSNLKIGRILLPFIYGHVRNFIKRIFYSYFLRDFHVASLQILFALPLLFGGLAFGAYHWWRSITTGVPASAGTVMIGALPILTGLQLALSALAYDVANVPRDAVHPVLLAPDGEQSDEHPATDNHA